MDNLIKNLIINNKEFNEYCNNMSKIDKISFQTQLSFKCKTCGKVFFTSLIHWKNGKKDCQTCINTKVIHSSIESLVKRDLDELLRSGFIADYKHNLRFDDDRKYIYDFVITKDNEIIVLELDGPQHFGYAFDKEYTADTVLIPTDSKSHNHKKWYCEQNGYKLIRIPFTEFKQLNMEELKQKISCK